MGGAEGKLNPTIARVIGVTGGIAMGKTTVSNYLDRQYHLPIFDADCYARDAVAVGSPILATIVDRYGSQLLKPDGNLDRPALGQIVFTDPTERQWLETQIHPYVRAQLIANRDRALAKNPTRPVVLVVPLLFEAEMTELVTEIWVIYCQRDRQLHRLMDRDGLTRSQANARLSAQLDIQTKCNQAHCVLNNTTTVDALHQQIDRALNLDAHS